MYCNQCGNEIKEGEEFCSKCSNPLKIENKANNVEQVNSTNEHKDGAIKNFINENNIKSPMALIGFISSVLGAFILPYLLGAIAIVLGILALQQIKIDKKGKIQAIIAIVVGIIDIVIPALVQQGYIQTFIR